MELGVSLVMPVYNEAGDLPEVLASLTAQTFPHSRMYVIVIDGGSADGSADIVRAWFAAGDIGGEVAINPRRTIPTSLNAGIARARRDDIVVRLDAHTTYEPGYVAAIVRAFEVLPADVGCVGGSVYPRPETRFDRALVASLYTNPMGLGDADYRRATEPRAVRSVYLGAWRPGIVQAVGGFDEAWKANEDSELAARLREGGFSTYWIPLATSYRVKRGPLAAVQQWGKYGFWRAQTLRRHPSELRVRHLAPPLAIVTAGILLATPLRIAVAALYVIFVAGVFANRARGESFAVTLASCVFFPACQVAWALGLIGGLLSGRRSAQPSDV